MHPESLPPILTPLVALFSKCLLQGNKIWLTFPFSSTPIPTAKSRTRLDNYTHHLLVLIYALTVWIINQHYEPLALSKYYLPSLVASPLPTVQQNCHRARRATALHPFLGGIEHISRPFKRNAHCKNPSIESITYLRWKFHSWTWINEFLYYLKLLFFTSTLCLGAVVKSTSNIPRRTQFETLDFKFQHC